MFKHKLHLTAVTQFYYDQIQFALMLQSNIHRHVLQLCSHNQALYENMTVSNKSPFSYYENRTLNDQRNKQKYYYVYIVMLVY